MKAISFGGVGTDGKTPEVRALLAISREEVVREDGSEKTWVGGYWYDGKVATRKRSS